MMSQNGNVISTTCAGGVADIPGLLTCEPGDEELILALIRQVLNTTAAEKDKRFDEFCNYLKQNSIESFTNSIHKELVASNVQELPK
jgi:trehalose-6-phosphate synthase